jgi:hypothetical protein
MMSAAGCREVRSVLMAGGHVSAGMAMAKFIGRPPHFPTTVCVSTRQCTGGRRVPNG